MARIEIETVCDEDGWCWRMPKLSPEDVKRLGLGTWDLADWTWGTAAIPISLFTLCSFSHRHFNPFTKLAWKVENRLRCLFWKLVLDGHERVARLVSVFRGIAFHVAWRLAEMDANRVCR